MFQIGFLFLPNKDYFDFANATEYDFSYLIYNGDILFSDENASIDFQYIPLIDFAINTLDITTNLIDKGMTEDYFEFTESSNRIYYKKESNNIIISFSYNSITFKVEMNIFKKVVNLFYKNIISSALEKNEDLKQNEIFSKYVAIANKL